MAEIVGYLSVSCAIKLLWSSLNSGRRPSSAEYVGQVSEISIFPVKSLKGVQLQTAECTNRGLKYPGKHVFDRNFMVVDENGTFVSGRAYPKMPTITTTIRAGEIVLESPSMSALHLPHTPDHLNTVVDAKVWGEGVEGHYCGDEASLWISQCLNVHNLRLVYCTEGLMKRTLNSQDDIWKLDCKDEDKVTFQDGFPYLLACESSLDNLNDRKKGEPFTMSRFRPNIVVSNTKAFDEDDWREIWIGESKFTNMKPCTRCSFTTVDPEKGIKDENMEPLKTLRRFRLDEEKFGQDPLFGINLVLDNLQTCSIQVGDPVYVFRQTQSQ